MCKKIIVGLLFVANTLSLIGCTTTHYVADGVIKESYPLHHFDMKPGEHTKKSGISGLTYGAIGGVVVGGVIGATVGLASMSTPEVVVIGGLVVGAAGAIYYGVLGGLLGLTGGYVSDLAHKNYPHYELKAQTIPHAEIYTIKQYTTEIPLNTRVRIFEKNGEYFVRKMSSAKSTVRL